MGDTAFEAKQVRKACGRRGWSWVVPLNPERRLAGAKPRPPVKSLADQLTATDFRQVSIRLDDGGLADLARVSPKRSKPGKQERTYWVHHRTEAVLNVGAVGLLFSTKQDPMTPGGVTVQKVLMTNALTATTGELVGWYSLRWQIELSFKEMKSELGMCRYKLGPFQRVEGWVGLAVVAFCYLEWYRCRRQAEARGDDQPFWRRLRTAGLKEEIRQQVLRADLEGVLRVAATADGQETLRALLDRTCGGTADAA